MKDSKGISGKILNFNQKPTQTRFTKSESKLQYWRCVEEHEKWKKESSTVFEKWKKSYTLVIKMCKETVIGSLSKSLQKFLRMWTILREIHLTWRIKNEEVEIEGIKG